MKKIILDTDPGVDDSLAITLACFSKLDILGITTVYGNASIENTTRNALTILEVLSKNIPVYRGASRPLAKDGILAQSHGKNGLGGFQISNMQKKEEQKNAVDFLIDSLEKSPEDQISIIALGPTTNLAILAILRPDLIKRIKELVILGGVFFEKGNITPVAEFNVFNDPNSLRILLNLDVDKLLIPIDVCRKVIFRGEDFEKIENPKISEAFRQISKVYIDYYSENEKFDGGVMYDLLAVSYVLDQELFKIDNLFVEVDVEPGILNGQTKIDSKKASNIKVARDVDVAKLKKLFYDTLNSEQPVS